MKSFKKQSILFLIALVVIAIGLIQLTEPAYAMINCNNCTACNKTVCFWDYCDTGNMEITTCEAWCPVICP